MTRRTTVPPADVPCEHCPNHLLGSEAAVSRRAYAGRVLCWHCRLRQGTRPTVHQVPAGCSVSICGTGFGLWNATLTAPDGREFVGRAWTDHQALSSARAAATAAGALPA